MTGSTLSSRVAIQPALGDRVLRWPHSSLQGIRHASHQTHGVKAKAMSAAAHILETRGIEALNLRAIAEEAGIGIASMYHYFSNKEDILLSLGVMGFESLRRDMIDAQPSSGALPIGASAVAFFKFSETRAELFSLMFNPRLLARHEALREAENKTFLTHEAVVQSDPRIPKEHHQSAAYALWALARGMAAIMSSQPDGKLPPELADRLMAGAGYLLSHPS